MLEILFVIFLWRKLGDYLEGKGYLSTILMKLFLVVSWIAGEIVGAVIGVIAAGGESGIMAYVGALIGAFCGAGFVFLIAKLLPVKEHGIQPLVHERPPPVQQQMARPAQTAPAFEPPVPGQPRSDAPVPQQTEQAAPPEFACPHCHNAIAWSPEFAGTEVDCPHCSESLVVPQEA